MLGLIASVVGLFVLPVGAARAQQIEVCRAIKNDSERLVCYDRLQPTSPGTPTDPKTAPTALTNVTLARSAITRQLKDPQSATFADLKEKTASDGTKAVCGTVNAKNSFGGYVGAKLFVYVVSAKRAHLLVSDTAISEYAAYGLGEGLKAYDKYCK